MAASASSSGPNVELDSQPVPVNVRSAKKAIAKVARVLRETVLASHERKSVLVKQGLLEQIDVENVVKGLQKKIEERPSLFEDLLRELSKFPDGADVAKKLQADYQGNSLREELREIKAESKPEEVKKDLIKKSLKAFIRKCLHMRIDACTILDVLEKLQSNLLSVDVYEWCKGELENSNKPDSPSPPEKCVQHPIVSEVNFCKEVVQNSLVTCHLLEQEDMSIKLCGCENSLIEGNKSIGLRPDIAKPTQHEGPVHRYLVASAKGATNSVIYYIAFSSHQSLREWSDSYESLQEGLVKQQKQLPIQFILDMLWKGASVVLTGFSFGGNLAQLCAVQLHSLSQNVCPELVDKNLLCVTFGQPIMSDSESFSGVTDGKLAMVKSRFHAIYITDDVVPRMLRCLDPAAEESENQTNQRDHEPFQNGLNSFILRKLIVLQEYESVYVLVEDVQSIDRGGLDNQHSSENASNPSTKSRPTDNFQMRLKDAVQELHSLLRPLKQKELPDVPPYVTYWKLGTGKLHECRPRDLALPVDTAIHENLFSKHKIDHYLYMIRREYIEQEPKLKFMKEAVGALGCSKFVTPSVTKIEIHHFTHRKKAALSLEGENLYFTSKIKLSLDKSKINFETTVSQEESVSRRFIVIQELLFPLPSEFAAEDGASNDYQEFKETAGVHLFTHFGEFVVKNRVEVRHKKFYISPRRRQMADLPVSQVIELSFIGALLERPPDTSSHSASEQCQYRSTIIQEVMQLLVDVVPIESIFSCIANTSSDQDACQICQVLKLAEIKPPLSRSFFVNAGLAIMKLLGDSDSIYSQHSTELEDLFHVIFVAAKKLSSPIIFWWRTPEPESRHLRWFGPDIATNCHNSDSVKYLQAIVKDAIEDSKKESKVIPAISEDSIASLFKATRKLEDRGENPLPVAIKSPMCILSKGKTDLQNLQSSEAESTAAVTVNTLLLDFVKKIRSGDLHTCIQIITAFMEEQVHVPISDFHRSVSIWKLLKLGLLFRKKVSKEFVTHYTISESKHIQNVTNITDHKASSVAAKRSAAADSKYAGKLHFLLFASSHHNEPPPVIDEHLTLSSLEDNLCARFAQASVPIDESTPLNEIKEKWDVLFRDVGMSTVVHTHRRLVAQWLKFSLLIRKLRENLSCHTTVSIIGLVNSGKSTLVKELFKIDGVKTGTLSKKRTTVPFLYGITGVENFDVIDFPAVDDQDEHIKGLVNLLSTLSQLVVFVVNYSDAHTTKATQWYKVLNGHALPHLICLTHGDCLYDECKRRCERASKYKEVTPDDIKLAIQKEVKMDQDKILQDIKEASDSSMQCVKMVSLKMDNHSILRKTADVQKSIQDAGIEGVKDIGEWIVKSMEVDLKEAKTAQELDLYFQKKLK